jgi:hypothetical protein
MVRPDRFERPTLWFEAKNRRTFIGLAVGTTVVQHCALFRVIKEFRVVRERVLAMLRNASLQGVGTKMAHSVGEIIVPCPLRARPMSPDDPGCCPQSETILSRMLSRAVEPLGFFLSSIIRGSVFRAMLNSSLNSRNNCSIEDETDPWVLTRPTRKSSHSNCMPREHALASAKPLTWRFVPDRKLASVAGCIPSASARLACVHESREPLACVARNDLNARRT